MKTDFNNLNLLYIYIILINIITLITFGIDKYNARKRVWRIPEVNLLVLSLLGGSLGGIIGMNIFKHKTQKLKFVIGMPIMLIFNFLIWFYLTK